MVEPISNTIPVIYYGKDNPKIDYTLLQKEIYKTDEGTYELIQTWKPNLDILA